MHHLIGRTSLLIVVVALNLMDAQARPPLLTRDGTAPQQAPETAGGPFDALNVSLLSWIDLDEFGDFAGNDCWGYVSPSGREYALMGLESKVAFVEVTNPASAYWFDSIPHTGGAANPWCDIKVYQDHAYAVTEESGTGIQVIDMSNIDARFVSLVRTIPSPGTSHNIAVDADSGFLYTCGSREGSATTVIFDLSNPAHPVEVGTWDDAYLHDAQIVTYIPPGRTPGVRSCSAPARRGGSTSLM